MKTLVVEDDYTSRALLQETLARYGDVHVATDGREAIDAVIVALYCGSPYDLICMDTILPEMDVREVLRQIRKAEEACEISSTYGSKIIMIAASGEAGNLVAAYNSLCSSCLVKPIDRQKMLDELRGMNLISS